jgi:hypothetical protein
MGYTRNSAKKMRNGDKNTKEVNVSFEYFGALTIVLPVNGYGDSITKPQNSKARIKKSANSSVLPAPDQSELPENLPASCFFKKKFGRLKPKNIFSPYHASWRNHSSAHGRIASC